MGPLNIEETEMNTIKLTLSQEDVISLKLATAKTIDAIEEQIGKEEVVRAHPESHMSRLMRLDEILRKVQLGTHHMDVEWID